MLMKEDEILKKLELAIKANRNKPMRLKNASKHSVYLRKH